MKYRQTLDKLNKTQFDTVTRINRQYNMKYWRTLDRMYKTPVGAGTQNQQTIQHEVMTDIGQTLQDTSGSSDTETANGTMWSTDIHWADCTNHQWTQWHRTNRPYFMKYWQTMDGLYKTPVNTVTEQTYGTMWYTDRHLKNCKRQQWTQWHRTNRRYIMKNWQTLDRLNEASVDAVSQNKQTVN